jgi:hypothetical protein
VGILLPVVNFTNILQAAFLPKKTASNDYRKAAQNTFIQKAAFKSW